MAREHIGNKEEGDRPPFEAVTRGLVNTVQAEKTKKYDVKSADFGISEMVIIACSHESERFPEFVIQNLSLHHVTLLYRYL
jgi:hypothetical protein